MISSLKHNTLHKSLLSSPTSLSSQSRSPCLSKCTSLCPNLCSRNILRQLLPLKPILLIMEQWHQKILHQISIIWPSPKLNNTRRRLKCLSNSHYQRPLPLLSLSHNPSPNHSPSTTLHSLSQWWQLLCSNRFLSTQQHHTPSRHQRRP